MGHPREDGRHDRKRVRLGTNRERAVAVAHPYHHALSSVKKWGGRPEDTLPIHNWFDQAKQHFGDVRHRALRHHTHGVFECERVFGTTLTLSSGRTIPVRWVAEQHVIEDLGRLVSLAEWLSAIQPKKWMSRSRRLSDKLEREIAQAAADDLADDRAEHGERNPSPPL